MTRRTALVFAVLTLMASFTACHKVSYNGQTGKILHKKYNPALNISYIDSDSVTVQTWDTLYIDLDQDKSTDLKVYFEYSIPFIQAMKDWQICILETGNLNITDACWWGQGIHVLYDFVHPIAVVHNAEDGAYYGWLDAYSFLGSDGQQRIIRFYLRETAFCTCINYPLRWGEE
ncbi:hypothetical protein [Bacteroides heparinolyticus]|uniref:hypothetical protein n=1 Tax=Prevotella heparinolytica TaxID=28113 RepID=UPI00359FDB6E